MRVFQHLLVIFVFSSFIPFLSGCNKSQVSKQELLAYMEDESHSLHKKTETGNVSLEVIYKPQDLIVEQEIDGRNYKSAQIDSIRNVLNEFDYFTLRISNEGKDILNYYASDPAKYNEALDYLSFKIGSNTSLINESDSIDIFDSMYFRGYGVSNAAEVLLVFKSGLKKKSGSFQILFDDGFFETGSHEFNFETTSLKSIPILALNR